MSSLQDVNNDILLNYTKQKHFYVSLFINLSLVLTAFILSIWELCQDKWSLYNHTRCLEGFQLLSDSKAGALVTLR